MRKYLCSTSRWHRSLMGSLWGPALLSCLVLLPSSASAQTWADLKEALQKSSDLIGYVGKASSAADLLAKFMGLYDDTNPIADLESKMATIANYFDAHNKKELIREAYDAYSQINNTVHESGLPGGDPISQSQWYDWFLHESADAVNAALSPGLWCTQQGQFVTLPIASAPQASTVTTYEWRPGIREALAAVATRLMVIANHHPTFRSDGLYIETQFIPLLGCLKKHRDWIKPAVKPTPYCVSSNCGANNSTLECKENRNVSWKDDVPLQTMSFSACRNPATSNSETAFTDLEEIAASRIDHENLQNVVFSLQRVIDTLYLYVHSPVITPAPPSNLKDLTETDDKRIYFGANSSLCLTEERERGKLIVVNCSDTTNSYMNWTYDRSRGSIRNNNENGLNFNQCIAASTFPANNVYVTTCTPAERRNADAQTWSWNPESGVIRNALGAVLAVDNPVAGADVSARPENQWYFNKQAWASDPSVCAWGGPAFCPIRGSAAWNQGIITMPDSEGLYVNQRYPLDFNVFTYEKFEKPIDVAGPIASAGAITYFDTSGSNINHFTFSNASDISLPVAIVSAYGPVKLFTGTVWGATFIPFDNTRLGILPVTQFNPNYPPNYVPLPAATKPINFEMAFLNLQAYSKKLARLPATGTVSHPSYSQLLLSGAASSPGDLVVFNLNQSDFDHVYEIDVEVSGSPAILVNVAGRSCGISYAGWKSNVGNFTDGKTSFLWNYPDATSFRLDGMAFRGSILAPFADATLGPSAINGTFVAWSLGNAGCEFTWNPLTNYQKYVTP